MGWGGAELEEGLPACHVSCLKKLFQASSQENSVVLFISLMVRIKALIIWFFKILKKYKVLGNTKANYLFTRFFKSCLSLSSFT